jgi:hypothetical protein
VKLARASIRARARFRARSPRGGAKSRRRRRPAECRAREAGCGQPGDADTDGLAGRAAYTRGIAAWNRRDWEAALERIDADVEWRGATELLDLAEVSRGHEGVREFWRRWTESWTDIRAEVEEFVPMDGKTLALVRWRAWVEEFVPVDGGTLALVRWRARSPARLEVDQPVAFHFELRDHMVTRFVSYWECSQAFKALGLPTPG